MNASHASGFYVYAYLREKSTLNGEAGTPYYIGKGIGARRFTAHNVPTPKDRNNNTILNDGLSEEEAFREERRLIAHHGRIDIGTGCLRNRTDGGEGPSGIVHTLATRQRMSERQKMVASRPEYKMWRVLQPPPFLGKRHSEESRRRVSEAKKGRPTTLEHRLKLKAACTNQDKKGKPLSLEHRLKIRQSHLKRLGRILA